MGIPQSVLEGFEEAEKFFNQQDGTKNDTPDKSQQNSVDDDDAFVHGFDSAEETVPVTDETEQETVPGTDESITDTATNHNGQQADNAAAKPEDANQDWQQRARVAEGRLQVANRELARLRQLEQQWQQPQQPVDINKAISDALAQREQMLQANAKREALRRRFANAVGLNDEDATAFDEMLNAYIPAPQEKPAPVHEQRHPPVHNASKQDAALHAYISDVGAAVGDPNKYLNNAEFTQWLYGTDPLSGSTRDAVLRQADHMRDSRTVLRLFSQFDTDQQQLQQKNMQQDVSPGRSRAGAQKPIQGQKYLSPDQIMDAQMRRDAAMLRGDWATADKLDKQIQTANQHYRI